LRQNVVLLELYLLVFKVLAFRVERFAFFEVKLENLEILGIRLTVVVVLPENPNEHVAEFEKGLTVLVEEI